MAMARYLQRQVQLVRARVQLVEKATESGTSDPLIATFDFPSHLCCSCSTPTDPLISVPKNLLPHLPTLFLKESARNLCERSCNILCYYTDFTPVSSLDSPSAFLEHPFVSPISPSEHSIVPSQQYPPTRSFTDNVFLQSCSRSFFQRQPSRNRTKTSSPGFVLNIYHGRSKIARFSGNVICQHFCNKC